MLPERARGGHAFRTTAGASPLNDDGQVVSGRGSFLGELDLPDRGNHGGPVRAGLSLMAAVRTLLECVHVGWDALLMGPTYRSSSAWWASSY